jgi:hypothetical protein
MNSPATETTIAPATPAAALTDPTERYILSRRGRIIASILLLLALLPPLFLPIGPDEAIFLASGRKILQGAIHYRDIIDVKPPAIYYIYAAAVALFGTSDIGIHLFDLLLQALTLWWIVALVRRVTANDLTAVGAAFWYAILYSGMRFGCEMQSESYCGLLAIPIIWLLLYRRTFAGFFAVGVLVGGLLMLKFTLGALLVAAIVSEWTFHRREGTLIAHLAAMGAGLAAVAGLFLLYLVALDALPGFLQVQQFIGGYGRIESASPARWVEAFIAWAPPYFARHYSLLFLLAVPLGLAAAFRRGAEHAPSEDVEYLLRFSALAFILLFGTVALEGRYYVYHFSRLYPFAAILGTFGIALLLRWMRRFSLRSRSARGAVYIAIPILLILSPLSRYIWQSLPVARSIAHGRLDLGAIHDDWGRLYPRAELKRIGAMIRERRHPGDELFASSTVAGLVHLFADDIPSFRIFHSGFLSAPFAPPVWRDETSAYLLTRRPRFIVAQRNDPIYTLTASNLTSEQTLLALPGIDSLLRTEYTIVLDTGEFVLFERAGRLEDGR